MNNKGFTLIELMVVVAIVALLAAIGYPSYQKQMVNTRRDMARACLTELSQWMERYYSSNMSYANAQLPATQCRSDLSEFYTFAFSGTPAAETFTISATAIGRQAEQDAACSPLTINQNAVQNKPDCS